MYRSVLLSLCCAVALAVFSFPGFAGEKPKNFEDRWFYASFGLANDDDARELTELVQLAGNKGLNGMLWACGAEGCGRWSAATKARFLRVKKAADLAGVEIIPIIWSVGYGTMLGRDNNLVAGVKYDNVPYRVDGNKAVYCPSMLPELPNLSMEDYEKDRLKGGWSQDSPGIISFVDTAVRHTGNSSIRFENFTYNKYGHGRLMRQIELAPNRQYAISIWYKAEGLQGGNFMFQLYRTGGGQITANRVTLPKDGSREWSQARLFFNSGASGKVGFYAGLWGGKEGKVWFDDLAIEELGVFNPIQRPGTPITVTDAKSGKSYAEGRDYTLPANYKLSLGTKDTKSIEFVVPEGSGIKDGTDLFVSYYGPARISNSQLSVCMSEPELYEFFRESARDMKELFAPKKFFLSMDEIRAGGCCQACKRRGISLAAILGDCITQQYKIIREVEPDATVYIWSDMLDPNHNCHADYMLCEGDFTGAWDLIPKDLVISCWYHDKRGKSMKFFSEKGFRTQGAAYYDTDTLDSCVDWLKTCDETPRCTGIMYTTWQKKYKLLVPFAELLKR